MEGCTATWRGHPKQSGRGLWLWPLDTAQVIIKGYLRQSTAALKIEYKDYFEAGFEGVPYYTNGTGQLEELEFARPVISRPLRWDSAEEEQ